MNCPLTISLQDPNSPDVHSFDVVNACIRKDLLESSVEAVWSAAKYLAGRQVNYDSFGSDSAYLARLEAVAATFHVLGVSKTVPNGETPRKYFVEGAYSNYPEGGSWADHVVAVDDEDAKLQAKFLMACGEGDKKQPTVGDYENFSLLMEDEIINNVTIDPVPKHELIDLLRTLALAGEKMIMAVSPNILDEYHEHMKSLSHAVTDTLNALTMIDGAQKQQQSRQPGIPN